MADFTIEQAIDFFTDATKCVCDDRIEMLKDEIISFGNLHLPIDSDEAKTCKMIEQIMVDYAKRSSPPRPLSIAVFGSPGSGKSFGVKEIASNIKNSDGSNAYESPWTINMSQVSDSQRLGQSLLEILAKPGTDGTRVIFFDEFDSSLDDEPLAWLKWFLAPMQDGVFFLDGKKHEVGKALLVFAGGTASNFEEFQNRYENSKFIDKKGPDFLSRLRGILNVEGVNAVGNERVLRRSLVLHYQLGERSEKLVGKQDTRNIEKVLLTDLLTKAHYVHGSRSVEAMLEMSRLTDEDLFHIDLMPKEPMLGLHVAKGAMEKAKIGVAAGANVDKDFLKDLSTTVLQQHATLYFDGDLFEPVLTTMIEAAAELPKSAFDRIGDDRPIQNAMGDPSFHNPDMKKTYPNYEDYVKSEKVETLSASEKEDLKIAENWFRAKEKTGEDILEQHVAWALSLFRRRLRMAQRINFLIVVGGNDEAFSSWGRFPGIAEEVMLALAFKKPIYLLGVSGGAAEHVGTLMGLAETHETIPNSLLAPENENEKEYIKFKKKLDSLEKKFEVPYCPDLPKTLEELRSFLSSHAPATDNWPNNGLTLEENKLLLSLSNDAAGSKRTIELVEKGISNVLWKKPVT